MCPRTSSATARPPRMPGLKASMTAAARSALGGRTLGLECSSTTTTGVSVPSSASTTASSRATCPPCRSRVAVEQPSPVRATVSPSTTTARSAARADATASASWAGSTGAAAETGGRGCPSGKSGPSGSGTRVSISAPRACVTVQDDGTEAVEDTLDGLAGMTVGHPVHLAGRAGPVAEVGLGVVGVGSEDGHGAREVAHGIRQRAVVGEEHERAPGDLEGERGVIGGADDEPLALGVRRSGVLEEAELELESQDATGRLVDLAFVEQAAGHGLLRGLEEGWRRH